MTFFFQRKQISEEKLFRQASEVVHEWLDHLICTGDKAQRITATSNHIHQGEMAKTTNRMC